MNVLRYYLKENLKWIGTLTVCMGIMAVIVQLNHVPVSEWFYGVMLCLLLLLTVGGVDYILYYGRHVKLRKAQNIITVSLDTLETPREQTEADYQELIRLVHEDKLAVTNRLENARADMNVYYTMWVHQIKTPIAAMRLLLQTEKGEQNQELEEELFHIEQYVEMALQYTRLDSESTDLIIRHYELDDIVREAVRKYAKLFIRKKINLNYSELHTQVLTDEKWLGFVIEQIISNAIKYTANGSISIYMKEDADKVLVIEDTGIGIRQEDLPRVCEKGYTGYNGHRDKRSTGIGLYLCKRILKLLSHEITIESEVGKGTKVMINLHMRESMTE